MDNARVLYTAMRFNFLYVDRYVFRAGWIYPLSYTPYCLVRYIIRGKALFEMDGTDVYVEENQVVYIPEGCMLSCRALDDYLEFISIRFTVSTQLRSNDILQEYYNIQPITDVGEDPDLLNYFQAVYENATTENTGKMFRIRGNLELIIAWLVEHAPKAVHQQSDQPEASFSVEAFRHREMRTSQIKRDPRIQVVVDYLISHPTEPLDSSFLSEMANMSKSSLRRLFKEHTGKSCREFVKELRLVVAARRLLTSDQRVEEIAYEVGYDDPNYFSRLFRETYGVSPQTYRKMQENEQ